MPFQFTDTLPHGFSNGKIYLGAAIGTTINHVFNRYPEIGVGTEKNIITIASARTGKGACLIGPNLLRWQDNIFCIDPSGENVEMSWQTRERMGQKVRVLDPFKITKIPDRLRVSCNLLGGINLASLTAREDILSIGDGMVARYDVKHAQWDNAAADLLSGIAAHVATTLPPDFRTLLDVRRLLMQPKDALRAEFEKMAANPACGGLARAGGLLGLKSLDARNSSPEGSAVSGARENTKWLDSDAMEAVLFASDFDVSELKTGRCSLFIVLPIRFLGEYSRFLRLFVRCAVNAMEAGGKGGARCLFILDEFYSLGRMDHLQKTAGGLPKTGVHLWPFLQDLGQLVELYGEQGSETFFANSDIQIFFGLQDSLTTTYVSSKLGNLEPSEVVKAPPQHRPYNVWFDRKIFENEQEGRERHNVEHQNRVAEYNHLMGLSGRPRLTPSEVRELVAKKDGDKVARRMIVFGKGNDVFCLRPVPYFQTHTSNGPIEEPPEPRRHLYLSERVEFTYWFMLRRWQHRGTMHLMAWLLPCILFGMMFFAHSHTDLQIIGMIFLGAATIYAGHYLYLFKISGGVTKKEPQKRWAAPS